MDSLTLHRLLEIFNSPINEEQAWAVCYQCAKYIQNRWTDSPTDCLRFYGVYSVKLGRDGNVEGIVTPEEHTVEPVRGEYELVQSLGVVVFQALDWGLGETEEQRLSPALEGLIERMTGSESDEDNGFHDDGDEGFDAGDDGSDVQSPPKITLEEVLNICSAHLPHPSDATGHYKAVCRALVTEALELISFLDKISKEKEKLKSAVVDTDQPDGAMLDQLQRSDWARLWIQVMRDLRRGVHLKKVEHIDFHQGSLEYELTPYEMLMEDIRTRRYTLRQVLRDGGDIPLRTKKDAHEIILEFIRSRPPLHPVKDRKLNSPPPKSPDIREQLLESIRSEPKLKPTPSRYVVETSRTKLKDDSGSPVATRKIIKPDLSLLMSNSFDEDDDDDDDLFGEDRNHVSPGMLSPLSPLASIEEDRDALYGPSPWQQTVAYDLANLDTSRKPPERRHSISVMETPASKPLSKRNALECLSLTIEEVMHIRSVLTKAELECLVIDPELQALLAKGKVCFTCKQTKFSLFGQWATKCKFCRRNVCSKCCSKMRIPTEHFEHVPVYTLSPSPLSPSSNKEIFTYEKKTGSAPNSPELNRKKMAPGTAGGSPPLAVMNNNNKQIPTTATNGTTSATSAYSARPILQRAQTLARPLAAAASEAAGVLQGPLMNVCKDCKAMIVNIIRSSRTQLAKAPELVRTKVQMPNLRRFHSFRTPRNFHLDLKPVYK